MTISKHVCLSVFVSGQMNASRGEVRCKLRFAWPQVGKKLQQEFALRAGQFCTHGHACAHVLGLPVLLHLSCVTTQAWLPRCLLVTETVTSS